MNQSYSLGKFSWGVVLQILVKKGPLGIHFLKWNPNISEPNREPALLPFWVFEQLPQLAFSDSLNASNNMHQATRHDQISETLHM